MLLPLSAAVSVPVRPGSSAAQFRARVRMVFARPLAKAPAQPIDVDGAVEVSVSASSGQAASVVPSASRRKRPRRNARAQQTLCAGLPELPCRYAADGSGAPAQGKHAGRCIFCSSAAMARVIDTPQGRGNVVRLLKRWRLTAPDIFEAALSGSTLASAPEAVRLQVRFSAERPVRGGPRGAPISQDQALRWRQSVAAAPDAAQLQEYRAQVADDRAYVQRKFFPQRDRLVRHADFRWRNPMSAELQAQVQDLAFNDTGLPPATITPMATRLETWCKQHSWKVCALCGMVQPQ